MQNLRNLLEFLRVHSRGRYLKHNVNGFINGANFASFAEYVPGFSTNYARFLFCINASCLFSTCPKCVLVWGNCCEQLRVEIFLRVLRSSRVNLSTVNDTNVFCFVWIESPFIYFLLQSSILCYKSSVGNKVQFLVESF